VTVNAAAAAVLADFDRRSAKGMTGEVDLFRALLAALRVAPGVQAEEYHGSGHQVRHTTIRQVGLGDCRCELSDLMLVSFHQDPSVSPRLTFLQAKYERGPLTIHRAPKANYVQWSLLAGRPPIIPTGKFHPPADLLKGALLPSVGTFGFFVNGSNRNAKYDLVYASADALVPVHAPPAKRKEGRLLGLYAPLLAVSQWYPLVALPVSRTIGRYVEAVAASSLDEFLVSVVVSNSAHPVMMAAGPGFARG